MECFVEALTCTLTVTPRACSASRFGPVDQSNFAKLHTRSAVAATHTYINTYHTYIHPEVHCYGQREGRGYSN